MGRPEPMPLREAIDKWYEHREHFDEVKASTLARDRSVMEQFFRAATRGRPGTLDVHSVDLSHIGLWRMEREQRRLAPTSVNGEIRSVRSFFQWTREAHAASPKIKKPNPASYLKMRHVDGVNESLLRLRPEEWEDLLDSVTDPRNRWLMACALFTGMRASEVALATIADLDLFEFEDGGAVPAVWITRKKGTQKNQPDVRHHMIQSSEFQRELARWMKHYKRILAASGVFEIKPEFALVPAYASGPGVNARGADGRIERIRQLNVTKSPSRMEPIVQGALAALGYPTKKEGMHMLRRTFARGYYDDLSLRQAQGEILPDTPLRIVMAALGHKTQDTTEGYLGIRASSRALNQVMRNRSIIEKRLPVTEAAPAEVRPLRHLRSVG